MLGLFAGNPPDEVNVLAVELVCQLRYQCGLYSKTLARCFAIQVANGKTQGLSHTNVTVMHELQPWNHLMPN